jgi:hypothetical protein
MKYEKAPGFAKTNPVSGGHLGPWRPVGPESIFLFDLFL